MATQLRLPLGRLRIGPVDAVLSEGLEDGRDDYERLHDELEGLIQHLQRSIPYGPEFTKAWAKARADTCESHGWTEERFYAELDRRRKGRSGRGPK